MSNLFTLIDALKQIKEAAESHPCFIGYEEDSSAEEISAEGGDAAFVTLDIAWVAKNALDQIDGLK